METDPKILEEQAHQFLSQEKLDEAFKSFKLAADNYKSQGKHKQAALCFAAAAGCWSKKCGERTFYHAALTYAQAARQSEISGDLEYAALLYKYAAINYERDGDFSNFSECFYRSRESQRKFLTYLFINPKKIHRIASSEAGRGLKVRSGYFLAWFVLTLSCLIWGHGERPLRTFFCAIVIILFSAFFYTGMTLFRAESILRPGFFDSLYFSVATFTTVGYGDITAVGLSKAVAMLEVFCGIFIIPIFIVALSRKYLRI